MLKQLRRLQIKIKLIRKLLPIILSLRGWDYGEGEKLLIAYLEVMLDNFKSKASCNDKVRNSQLRRFLKLYYLYKNEYYFENFYVAYPNNSRALISECNKKHEKLYNLIWRLYRKYSRRWWD